MAGGRRLVPRSGGKRPAPGADDALTGSRGKDARSAQTVPERAEPESERAVAPSPRAPPRHAALPLIESKLQVPVLHPIRLERPVLLRRLDDATARRLTIVAAPTGYGKTTALASWAGQSEQPVAWVSLDVGDNDLGRYLTYIVTALARATDVNADQAMRTLRRSLGKLWNDVLAHLFRALGRLESPVVLVLDDYQRIGERACHAVTKAIVDQAPPCVRVVISSRRDPPLPVGLLRARGDLSEIRADDLRFSDAEAGQLLNDLLGLGLDDDLVAQLTARAEGWPAGLYLAALSLAAAPDPRAFVTSFAGSNRHVVEYLATEVVGGLPVAEQLFLLETSILDRLSAPLCDAVRGADDSAAYLALVLRTNLFLTPLDPQGEWYRYHRLFAEVLRSELARRRPSDVPELHRRAAAWHEAHGNLEETVYHALGAGDEAFAVEAIATHWRPLYQFGQHVTLSRLVRRIPAETVDRSAPLSFLSAVLAGLLGESREVFEHHLEKLEGCGWEGPFPDGVPSVEAAAAFARAVFPYGDLRRSLRAADRLYELAAADFHLGVAARLAKARSLYLLGDAEAAKEALPQLGRATAAERPQASVVAPALWALTVLEAGDAEQALVLAREAAEVAEEVGVSHVVTAGIAWLALGCALAAHGSLKEAETTLEQAAEKLSKPADMLLNARALLALARVRVARGTAPAQARKLLVHARELIEAAPDPGAQVGLLEELERRLSTRARRDISFDDLPTESELRVLRLMARGATRGDIARELFLSPNTIKSHQRTLYRKLGANSRESAVARARDRGLV